MAVLPSLRHSGSKVSFHSRRLHATSCRLQPPSKKENLGYTEAIRIFDPGKSKNLLSYSESYSKPVQSPILLIVCNALIADGKSTEIKSSAKSRWEYWQFSTGVPNCDTFFPDRSVKLI